MSRSPLPLLLSLCCVLPTAPAQEPASSYVRRVLTSAQALRDLDILRRALETIHPGLERYWSRAEREALFAGWEARAKRGAIEELELLREIAVGLAQVRCGHTRVEAPQRLDEWRERTPTHLPFTFRLFDGRMFVDRAAESAQGLSRGDEILALDGRATSELLELVGRTVNLDGFTDAARPSRLESTYEYRDSGFDHFLPLFHGFRGRFALRVRPRSDGEPRELEVAALRASEWSALAQGTASDFASGVRFEVLSPGVASLAIDTFVNYRRPVDPERVFEPLFDRLRTEKIQTLILDLRACGGGSDEVPLALLRRAIAAPIPLARRAIVRSYRFGDLVPHLSTWMPNAFEMPEELFRPLPDGSGYEILEPDAPSAIEPHPRQRFAGRWIALIGPRNASGATNLLAVLRERVERLTLVGAETAGNVEGTNGGLIFFLTLPESGIRVNVPVKRTWNPIRFDTAGRGLRPDIAAEETLESWLAGADMALAAAREIAAR